MSTATDRIPVMVPYLGIEEERAAAEAVASGWIAQGPRVAEFERAFAASVTAAHGVAVSSCTTALHLSMVACGIGPGDEVVVPSLSFIATANAVRYVGAEPVFADVDERTGNLTPDTVREVLGPRTRAIILVHQGGVPADVDAIRALTEPLGIAVVEDAACAAGSVYRDAPVGAGAQLATWSFHPRKLLTTGEGGMLTLDDADRAIRLRRLREHGMSVSAADRHASAGPVFDPRALVIALVVVEVLVVVATVLPAWRAGRVPTTVALAPVPPTRGHRSRLAALGERLGLGPVAAAGLRDSFARPARSMLTALALAVAVVAVVVTSGFSRTISRSRRRTRLRSTALPT